MEKKECLGDFTQDKHFFVQNKNIRMIGRDEITNFLKVILNKKGGLVKYKSFKKHFVLIISLTPKEERKNYLGIQGVWNKEYEWYDLALMHPFEANKLIEDEGEKFEDNLTEDFMRKKLIYDI